MSWRDRGRCRSVVTIVVIIHVIWAIVTLWSSSLWSTVINLVAPLVCHSCPPHYINIFVITGRLFRPSSRHSFCKDSTIPHTDCDWRLKLNPCPANCNWSLCRLCSCSCSCQANRNCCCHSGPCDSEKTHRAYAKKLMGYIPAPHISLTKNGFGRKPDGTFYAV